MAARRWLNLFELGVEDQRTRLLVENSILLPTVSTGYTYGIRKLHEEINVSLARHATD